MQILANWTKQSMNHEDVNPCKPWVYIMDVRLIQYKKISRLKENRIISIEKKGLIKFNINS